MTYNLYSANGYPLNYPHYTKWVEEELNLVTSPDNILQVGDIVFVAQESEDVEGNISYAYMNGKKPSKVIKLVEKRKAKGQHSTELKFEPIFQKVITELIPVQPK